jgi:hypothetical protein
MWGHERMECCNASAVSWDCRDRSVHCFKQWFVWTVISSLELIVLHFLGIQHGRAVHAECVASFFWPCL